MYPPPRSPRRGLVHRCRAAAVRLLALALTVAAALLFAAPGPAQAATTRQIAVPTAPMGWASWNSFAAKIDYNVIKQQVDAFVAAGLPAAGYKYINIDEGWWQGTRDSAGNITVDTGEWPGGMNAIADYIHSKGLKAGIYTDAGKDGCGYYYPTGRPAAAEHRQRGPLRPGHAPVLPVGLRLRQGRLVRRRRRGPRRGDGVPGDQRRGRQGDGHHRPRRSPSRSATGASRTPGTGRRARPPCGGPARTSSTTATRRRWTNLLSNFDQTLHPTAQHTGYYNDPDMLMVGMDGFTAAQNRTHMNLWAISGAPLLAGNNLATMTSETAAILKNPEVIAVDQDPRGLQGVKVAEDTTGLQVYGKVAGRHRQPRRRPPQPHLLRAEHHRPLVRPGPDQRVRDRP